MVGRIGGWWSDPFKRWLGIVLTLVGLWLIYREYGPLLAGFFTEPRLEPAVSRGAGAGGFAPRLPDTLTIPLFGEVELAALSLPGLAMVLGLVDGFNPCAMWALVYLISLIAGLADRRKIWLLAGSFVAASGALYFLFMTAWLNVFLFLGYIRLLLIVVGLLALGGGLVNLRDFVSRPGPAACPVAPATRQRTMGRMAAIVRAPISIGSLLAILALAFTVNAIEFACSAGLPAIFTQVLALHQLSAGRYYGYILLYDLCFMLDDLVIFSLAALALDTNLGHRYVRQGKLVGGVVLIGLGWLLLFAPELLR